MKENIKIALLALISVTLIINTFMKGDGGNEDRPRRINNIRANNATIQPQNNANPSAVVPIDNENIVSNEPFVDSKPSTSVVFDTYDHDFGDINQDTENEKIFAFKNTGSEPLVITNAKGSCGCTVPEYPKNPIAPGETGEIRVVYSPGKQQYKQTKSVTITANTEPPTTVLKVYANVIPSNPDQVVPVDVNAGG